MIGHGELFWPDFMEYDGCILKGGVVEENYREWMTQFGGDQQSVEKMMNHIDLGYLLSNPNSEATADQLTYLGRLLREMCQAKLMWQFPERRIVVEFIDEPGDEPLITVYQLRDEIPSSVKSN